MLDAHTAPILNFRVTFKIRVKFMVKVRVEMTPTVTIRMQFPLSIQGRSVGGKCSDNILFIQFIK